MTDIRLVNFLSEFILERRQILIDNILSNRTRYVTIVLEDIFHSHNASAVLRTSECFGIQDIHIIENRHNYQYNPQVAMGSGKWVHLHKYSNSENNSLEAIRQLKKANYRIVATAPGNNCTPLDDFDVAKGKFAIIIGSELSGISDVVRENADELITIPMFGFTESYNLSVSAALILQNVIGKLHKSDINWQLSNDEMLELKLEWLKASIKKPELLIQKFLHNATINNQ
jgi:tRNA (guanosine-2'-O-)-methyltransferase